MNKEQTFINVPVLCDTHRFLLIRQARYKETDPWMALEVAAQIALFQAATVYPGTHEKIGKDITRVSELGCLACYRPDAFGEIVEIAKKHDLGLIKELGEKWLNNENSRPWAK